MTTEKIIIATRESPLAIWQAEHVAKQIESLCHGQSTELLGMTTTGDQQLATSLSKIGGKGLFVKELETALFDGRADLAVHSGKDVPMQLPDGMSLSIIDRREDPRDALILPLSSTGAGPVTIASVQDLSSILPDGAIIGTSSLRRKAQLQAMCSNKNFIIKDLRGNLNTRLRKLDEREFDAIILAAAGMKRLGWEHRISGYFSTSFMLPAVAQGALAIEYSSNNFDVLRPILTKLISQETQLCVSAERAFNFTMQGSCQVPIAAHAILERNILSMKALVAAIDGSEVLEEEAEITINTDDDDQLLDKVEQFGKAVADRLLARGARRILDQAAQT